ncbi:hypothetical protein HK098_006899 [Nowakowskiella sp. JEL0407]|nr:hypothetical protein HK098_006899 [Nowakowskiella sp. JEL0407]
MRFQSSNEIPVEDLARGLRGMRVLRSRKSFSVPFSFVLLFFIIFILALAIIPTCLVVFSAVTGATSVLSIKTANSVIISTAAELKEIFGSVKLTADIFLENPSTRRVMENLSRGYGTQDDINLAAQLTLNASEYTERIVCVQRNNITGNAPASPVPGGKLYPLYQWFYNSFGNGGFTTQWCDYSNTTDCFVAEYDTKAKKLIPPILTQERIDPSIVARGFVAQKLDFCSTEGTWRAEAIFGISVFSYAKCARSLNDSQPSPYTCGTGFSGVVGSPTLLRQIAPTKDSRIVLTDTTGLILASNLNGTQYPTVKNITYPSGDIGQTFVAVSEYADAVISQIGKLISPSGTWKEANELAVDPKTLSVTNSKSINNEYTLNDTSKWIVTVAKISFNTPEVFYLIVGIPRKDFFDTVDTSIRTGIVLSSIFTFIGLIVGSLVTVGIVWPLQNLTKDMKLATTYDFSSLSNGGLKENSIFTEIQSVQKTFNIMMQAFAGAIQRNRASRFGKFDSDDSMYTGSHELNSLSNSRYYASSTLS